MKRCDGFQNLIEQGAYLDPTAEGYEALTAHAAECAECANRLAELRRAEDAMRGGLAQLDPGESFNRRVMAALEARPARNAVRAAWWRWAPLAAAAALVLTVLLPNHSVTEPDPRFRPESVRGRLVLADGLSVAAGIPYDSSVQVGPEHAAFEIVQGVGLALRPGTEFVVKPESTQGYTKVRLNKGVAAVSVKTGGRADKLEITLRGFSVLASDADFLVETRTNGDLPGLYVDRGRVVVAFAGGVSAVEQGEHIALDPATLLTRVHAGAEQLKSDLETLQAQCAELHNQIAQYEEMMDTYSDRRRERSDELQMIQEALAVADDIQTSTRLEARINKEMAAVENLDFVMGEHIAKMSALRAELPKRLEQLQLTRTLATDQRKALQEGLELLAGLR